MKALEDLELKVAKFLRSGVLVAGAFMLAGVLVDFQWAGRPFANLGSPGGRDLMSELATGEAEGDWGLLLSYMGLFILISLPVLRVFFCAVLLWKRRERLLFGVACVVLASLLVSFSLGMHL